MMSTLKVTRNNHRAYLPTRSTPGSAGYDLYAVEACSLDPGERCLIDTGISIQVPPNTYGRIAARSGMSVQYGIQIGAGVIDEDYRGNVKILMFNHGNETVHIKYGDRIAQLILEQIKCLPIEETDILDDTERGRSGFGSSGT